ncbi:MAG: tetratricopeptide repeat protein [Deltaproteobacteria bacterium]|nr:tetratricopeptide repeat protein [Deltaproteobacteria bacterium]
MANDSGLDLSQLEYEFATKPDSEAFIPLAQAYLDMGRFVEAMVVCKKGIKAHPELPDGRLIMAQIYAVQAKHQKAIDELNNLLKMSPQNADAFRLLGNVYTKIGREQEAVDYLKKALDARPDDEEVKGALAQLGVDYTPASAQPEPEPEPEPAEVTARQPGIQRAPTPAGRGEVPLSEMPTERAIPVAARRARPPKRRIADIYHEIEAREQQKHPSRKGFKATVGVVVVLALGLGIYILWSWHKGNVEREINEHLEAGRPAFKQDTYPGYKKALEHYQAIYELDKENATALERMAFCIAMLVGVHGEDSKLLAKADKYLREAAALGQSSVGLTNAQVNYAFYSGGLRNELIKTIERECKDNPDSPTYSSLQTTLGLILLSQGKLSEAKEALARGAAQSEMRSYVGLGDWALRRSLYREAATFFAKGLQTDREHTGCLLHGALTSLVRGQAAVYSKDAALKLQQFKSSLAEQASQKEKDLAEWLEAVLKLRDPKTRSAGFAELEKLKKKNASNPMFSFALARELRRHGDLKKAKETIEVAVRIDSTRPDFILEQASIDLKLRDYEAARAKALRVQAMDSESGQSSLLVGDAYRGEKNFDKAREWYEKCRNYDDVAATSYLRMGHVYLEQPKPDKDLAQSQLELAFNGLAQIGENRKAAEAGYQLALIYVEKNRINEFRTIIKNTLKRDPDYAPAVGLMAANIDLESKEGREKAQELCSKYLELAPKGRYAAGCQKIMRMR